MFELIFPGWLAGILLCFSTGPLGSFIVWRRMSSFGDTLSHSSILGLAISIIFQVNSFYVILFFTSLIAIILAYLEKALLVSINTILSIISHSSLSLGIICISLISATKPIDLNNYLFGDLLSINILDVFIIAFGSALILVILIYYWNDILLSTISEDLAKIDGINLFHIRLILMLTTSLAISIAIKFVGAVLITSLLIIPPAIAQRFSSSPEKMVIITIIISIISITGGILFSTFWNTPTNPSIVLFSALFYILSNIKIFFK